MRPLFLKTILTIITLCPFFSTAQVQNQNKVVNVKVYINTTTHLVFKGETPLKINSNANSKVLIINYDKINNIIDLTPLDKLSDYDSQIFVDIATDRQKYHFKLEYSKDYDKQILLKAPLTDEEKQAKKHKIELEKNERILFNQLLEYSDKKSEKTPLSNTDMILFNLKKIINSNNKIYLFTEVENISNIGYEVEAIKIKRAYYRTEKQQSPEIEDIIPYKILDRDYYDYRPLLITTKAPTKGLKNKFIVVPKQTETLVFILNKLTITKNEHIIITLFEKNGVRELEANLNNEFINNPTYISPAIKNSKTRKKTTIIKSKKIYSFKKKEFNITATSLFWANLFEFNVGFWRRFNTSNMAYKGNMFYLQKEIESTTTKGTNSIVGLNFGLAYRKPTFLRKVYFELGLNGNMGFQNVEIKDANSNGSIIFGADLETSLFYRISQKAYLGTTFRIKWLNSNNTLLNKAQSLLYPMGGLQLNITLN